MCRTKIHQIGASGIDPTIRKLEERHGMSSDEFLERYRSGEIDHEFVFNFWAQLIELRRMASEHDGSEHLDDATRHLIGA